MGSRHGQVEVEAELSSEVVRGAVNDPHGFGHAGGWRQANSSPGANINALASADPADREPVSGMCRLDGIAVALQAL